MSLFSSLFLHHYWYLQTLFKINILTTTLTRTKTSIEEREKDKVLPNVNSWIFRDLLCKSNNINICILIGWIWKNSLRLRHVEVSQNINNNLIFRGVTSVGAYSPIKFWISTSYGINFFKNFYWVTRQCLTGLTTINQLPEFVKIRIFDSLERFIR